MELVVPGWKALATELLTSSGLLCEARAIWSQCGLVAHRSKLQLSVEVRTPQEFSHSRPHPFGSSCVFWQ